MPKVLLLALREYKATVRTKGFIIGLVMAPILMSGGFIAMKIAEMGSDTTDKKIAVVDRSGMATVALEEAAAKHNAEEIYDKKTGKKARPGYTIETAPPNDENPDRQRLDLSDRVRRGELHGFVEIGADVLHPGDKSDSAQIAYYSKNAALDELRGWIGNAINNHLRYERLAESGVSKEQAKGVFNWIAVQGLELVKADETTGEVQQARRRSEGETVMVPIFMIILLFMSIMMGAGPLLMSVIEEKGQRIAEVLLGCVRPFEFMLGKLLGGVGVSLTAAAVYMGAGIISAQYMGKMEIIPFHLMPWFFAYMLSAIVMYGAMYAAVGSACNDVKDAQSLNIFITLPIIIPMLVLGVVLKEPLSGFSTALSLIPPFTPVLMMLRQAMPSGVPAWQPWVGLVGVVAFSALTVWAGGRIFRVGILMQGQPPKITNLLRWAIRG